MKHFVGLTVFAFALTSMLVGCKSNDSSGGTKSGDLGAVAESISSPTGELTSGEAAEGVAVAFATKLENTTMVPSGESATVDCTADGNMSMSADSTGTNITFDYNNCCETAGCCIDGPGWMAQNMDGFTMCMAFDVTIDCDDVSGSYNMEYCMGTDGAAWYLVEYENATYACTGYFDSETGGSWTIRDANAEWECNATCTDGSCTGSCSNGTDTYEW